MATLESCPDETPSPEEPQVAVMDTYCSMTDSMTMTAAQFEIAAYFEFLYGWGAAPGVDLGPAGSYVKVRTGSGSVYRQNFERGISLGNLGDQPAEVTLEHRYLDLVGNAYTTITIPAHGVKVLVKDR